MVKEISVQVKENPVCLIPDIVYSQPDTYFGYTAKKLKMHFVRLAEDELDAYNKTKRPTVVWVIGGAFQETAPLKFAPELAFLARAGYNVALIDYRICSEGQFPSAVEDTKTAVRFLRAHADRYGVDADRIAVMGDSAGGYLAAMAGVTGGKEIFEGPEWSGYDSSVKAVIDMYGSIDMEQLAKHPDVGIFNDHFNPPAMFLGRDLTDEKFAQADPCTYITENTPPHLILHGTADEMVPCEQSKRLYEALEKKNVPAELYLLKGVYHARNEFWQQEIKDIILDFLNKYL